MDRYELKILGWTGILLTIFLVAVLRGVQKYAIDVPECIPYDDSFTEPKIVNLGDSIYQIFVSAQMWNFEPSEIYLPVGAEVDFYLSSADVVHGFHIADKNINMMAVPGGINKASTKFTKPGIYPIVCHEYCGSGHQHMRGEIIVNHPSKK